MENFERIVLRPEDIRIKFEQVIRQEISFEQASEWAIMIDDKSDQNLLDFIPENKSYIYWSAINYLNGVDLLLSPNEYFHGIGNVIEQYEVYWGKYEAF